MQLEKALAQPGCAVFYFYSTQEFLVRDAAQKAVHHLMQGGDAELTRIEGPSPDIGEAVAAAGSKRRRECPVRQWHGSRSAQQCDGQHKIVLPAQCSS